MHKIYGQQIIWARHKGFVAPSFYSIVLDAFREFKNNPNRDPATMPRWMRMVQNFNDHALDMLKARVNYPAIEIFAECTNLNAMGSIGALYEIYWKDRKVWDLDLSDLKPSAIYRINEYLSYALQTRKALNDLGIDAEMTDDLKIPNLKSIPIRTIFSHINLVQQKDASNVAAQQVKIQISKFIYLKNLLLAPTQSFSRADGKTFDPPSQE
jgi:hypothetical protein